MALAAATCSRRRPAVCRRLPRCEKLCEERIDRRIDVGDVVHVLRRQFEFFFDVVVVIKSKSLEFPNAETAEIREAVSHAAAEQACAKIRQPKNDLPCVCQVLGPQIVEKSGNHCAIVNKCISYSRCGYHSAEQLSELGSSRLFKYPCAD